ncbi:hypothetical protein PTQ21_06200 [Paenibacillus marchantiae]|uniref:hypothetical protein n=1 Tax=Paenibacillus TaxID=44249 RepID=UPI00237B397D|nr:hypothetical protein [Paenibacillus marchantiae]WDQ33877.1 hypothetical protein PTQ21_06200 [Paenibacillus marchantiae]
MKKKFGEYLFSEFLFKLGMYQKLHVNIESYTLRTTKNYQSNEEEDYLEVYETRYSEHFQHLLGFFMWDENFFWILSFLRAGE